MLKYILKRILLLIPVLIGITFLSFALMHVAGSDVVTQLYTNRGVEVSQEIIDAKKATTNFTNMVTPDVVAKKALTDAEHGKDMSVYSTYVKTCHTIAKLLPQKTMMKLWLIQQRLL